MLPGCTGPTLDQWSVASETSPSTTWSGLHWPSGSMSSISCATERRSRTWLPLSVCIPRFLFGPSAGELVVQLAHERHEVNIDGQQP